MDSCLENSTGLAAILPFGSLRSGCIGAIEGINWTLIIGVAGCLLRMKSIGIGTSGTRYHQIVGTGPTAGCQKELAEHITSGIGTLNHRETQGIADPLKRPDSRTQWTLFLGFLIF